MAPTWVFFERREFCRDLNLLNQLLTLNHFHLTFCFKSEMGIFTHGQSENGRVIHFHKYPAEIGTYHSVSEMRLFSKLLSQTDIRKRLSIPMKSFASFPRFKVGHALDLQVKDESGNVWLFRFSIRKKNYLKPVFSKGWSKFVQSKNLQVGDKVKFYKEEEGATGVQFKIKAKKAVKIFGAIFGYAKA